MIILSVGMPRAGSGWFYNLTHDLALANGYDDAREIRRKYFLSSILTEVNCNIGALTLKRLIPVLIPSLLGRKFVIKSHAGLSDPGKFLVNKNLIVPTYIFRDPRDALLSALDYGKRAEKKGRPNFFSKLNSIEDGIEFMHFYLKVWEQWVECKQALVVKYEDLLSDFENEVIRLCTFLDFDLAKSEIEEVTTRYNPSSTEKDHQGLHFYKGRVGRFRTDMTSTQQELVANEFEQYLVRMGYEI